MSQSLDATSRRCDDHCGPGLISRIFSPSNQTSVVGQYGSTDASKSLQAYLMRGGIIGLPGFLRVKTSRYSSPQDAQTAHLDIPTSGFLFSTACHSLFVRMFSFFKRARTSSKVLSEGASLRPKNWHIETVFISSNGIFFCRQIWAKLSGASAAISIKELIKSVINRFTVLNPIIGCSSLVAHLRPIGFPNWPLRPGGILECINCRFFKLKNSSPVFFFGHTSKAFPEFRAILRVWKQSIEALLSLFSTSCGIRFAHCKKNHINSFLFDKNIVVANVKCLTSPKGLIVTLYDDFCAKLCYVMVRFVIISILSHSIYRRCDSNGNDCKTISQHSTIHLFLKRVWLSAAQEVHIVVHCRTLYAFARLFVSWQGVRKVVTNA